MNIPVFDAHEDIWTHVAQCRELGERSVFENHHLANHKAGNIRGGIFVIWIDNQYFDKPLERVKMIAEAVKAETEDSKSILKVATSRAIYDAAAAEGKIAAVFGLEGLSYIENDLSLLDSLYDMGARHASLTWNEENALATGAKGSADRGLTSFGRQAVKHMEAKGMLVDVSHLNEKSFWDLMRIKTTPMMASHSNARALCDHPRNLTDEQLMAIRDIGGVVGLNAYPGFVGDAQSFDDFVNQAIYLVEKIGIDHVGCGFDFCDYLKGGDLSDVIPGFEDHTKVPHFFEVLKQKGYAQEALEKIAHGNFERLLMQMK
ncbi:MAG: rane dipeptidase [Clostridiales bacterium]|jgi:membrane dipeptidase|nr:rane dipeptidase [Clostridiales bacterium]MDN5299043.1 rane dipeptidase [Clostridiales bacterium]